MLDPLGWLYHSRKAWGVLTVNRHAPLRAPLGGAMSEMRPTKASEDLVTLPQIA
jgi:hypothetical protein